MTVEQVPEAARPISPASGVPLAVIGFGFSVITLSLFNIGLLDADASGFFPVVAVFTGALLMLTGGIWEARCGNLFGATFAASFAAFLLTTGLLLQTFASGIKESAGDGAFNDGFGTYLLVWALFTAFITVVARYVNLAACVAFGLLAVVFLFAGLANLNTGDTATALTRIAGWAGILDGATAWYLAMAILLNGVIGRDLLPLRPYQSARGGS